MQQICAEQIFSHKICNKSALYQFKAPVHTVLQLMKVDDFNHKCMLSEMYQQ